MYTRHNQSNLTSTQKRRFTAAVLELKRNGAYDDLVRTHDKYFVPDRDSKLRVGHMSPSFFPWHRRYLLQFERLLQAVDPGVSVPYWDWTTDSSPVSSLWAEDFLGGTGRESDRRVMTGPFAHEQGNWEITVGITEAASSPATSAARRTRSHCPPRPSSNGRSTIRRTTPRPGIRRRVTAASATSWRAGPRRRASAGATTTRCTSGSAAT